MKPQELKIKVVVDTEEAEARLAYLQDLAEGIPDMEFEELEERTLSWPWVIVLVAGAAGGASVLALLALVAWLAYPLLS